MHLPTVSLGRRYLDKEGGWELAEYGSAGNLYLTNKLLQLLRSRADELLLNLLLSSRGMLQMNFSIYTRCLPIKQYLHVVCFSTPVRNICLGFFPPILGVLFNSCTVQEDQQGLCTMTCRFLDHCWPLSYKEFLGRNVAKLHNLPFSELC